MDEVEKILKENSHPWHPWLCSTADALSQVTAAQARFNSTSILQSQLTQDMTVIEEQPYDTVSNFISSKSPDLTPAVFDSFGKLTKSEIETLESEPLDSKWISLLLDFLEGECLNGDSTGLDNFLRITVGSPIGRSSRPMSRTIVSQLERLHQHSAVALIRGVVIPVLGTKDHRQSSSLVQLAKRFPPETLVLLLRILGDSRFLWPEESLPCIQHFISQRLNSESWLVSFCGGIRHQSESLAESARFGKFLMAFITGYKDKIPSHTWKDINETVAQHSSIVSTMLKKAI